MLITSRSERVNLRIGLIQTVHLEVPFSIKKGSALDMNFVTTPLDSITRLVHWPLFVK